MRIIVIGALTEEPECAVGVKTPQGFKMPWQAAGVTLTKDLRWFAGKTLPSDHLEENAVVMGHNTWMSIGERPLKGRQNFFITRDPRVWNSVSNNMELAIAYSDLLAVVDAAEEMGIDNLFVIGGPILWLEALPYADQVMFTIVHASFAVEGEVISCPGLLDEVRELFPPPRVFHDKEVTDFGLIELDFCVWE